jgi:hypothetical protein
MADSSWNIMYTSGRGFVATRLIVGTEFGNWKQLLENRSETTQLAFTVVSSLDW